MEGGNKMKTRLGGERNFRRFALITLGIMTILSLLPVILIVIASFTDENSLIANGYSYFPAKWSLDAYFYMIKQAKLITRAYGISFCNDHWNALKCAFYYHTGISYVQKEF